LLIFNKLIKNSYILNIMISYLMNRSCIYKNHAKEAGKEKNQVKG